MDPLEILSVIKDDRQDGWTSIDLNKHQMDALITLIPKLAALTSERDRLRLAARRLLNNLPDSEIELAREAWGNTNTRIIKDHRDALAAALDKDA